ncbi:MAG: hypothetical protein MIO90_03595 [Methanomassiliicoccales archaeon]|nr:hypothetical protein [Methanomassiliicoccales archaeon]
MALERRVRVPGGKALLLKVECQGKEVVGLRLRGDFFFFPEEGLAQLESFLLVSKVWRTEDLETVISRFMTEHGLQAVGFGPADIAYLLRGLKC